MMITSLAQEAGGTLLPATSLLDRAADLLPLLAPALLDLPEGMPGGRVDHGWAPGLLRPRAVPRGSLTRWPLA